MEFLMTYGWAILVVLAAIGALAYFGVLSPDRFLPRACTLAGGFACDDYKIDATDNQVRFYVINSALGEQANDVNVTLAANSGCTGTITRDTPVADIVNISSRGRQQYIYNCTGGSLSGAFSGDIDIDFTLAGDTESHSASGSISGQAES